MRALYALLGKKHPDDVRDEQVSALRQRASEVSKESKALESEWNSLVESWRREGFPIADAIRMERHGRKNLPLSD